MLDTPVNLRSPAVRTAEPVRDDAPLVLRTEADVLASRATLEAFPWERLDPEPEYFLTVVRSRPEVVRPHVALLPGGSAFVGRIEDVTVPTMLGYRELLRPRLRALTLVLGGVADADSPAAAAAVVGHVQATLAAREADVALLPALRTDSALFAAAQSLPSALCRRHHVERRTHWTLRVPGSYDEFLRSRSKKTRENLRVYRNRLFRDFHDDVRLRVFREPGEADELFRDVGSVAARTYQHGLGAAFAATQAERELVSLDLERDRFRVYVLYVGGEPAAFWQGSAWNRTFFVGTPGYDPALASYSIGTYVLARVIEDLCSDDAIDRLDFGSGEAEYKRRFGSESWEEADVAIFAARLRPIRVNLVQTSVEAAGAGAKRVLARTGLLDKLKRRWRARLAARSGDSPNG